MKPRQGSTRVFQTSPAWSVSKVGLSRHPWQQIPTPPGRLHNAGPRPRPDGNRQILQCLPAHVVKHAMDVLQAVGGIARGPPLEAVFPRRTLNPPQRRTAESAGGSERLRRAWRKLRRVSRKNVRGVQSGLFSRRSRASSAQGLSGESARNSRQCRVATPRRPSMSNTRAR